MSVNLHLLQASGRLEPYEEAIREATEEVVAEVTEAIKVPAVDIVVADIPRYAMEETGVAGKALTKHYVRIAVDPKSDEVRNNLVARLKSSIAHELSHCSRWEQVGRSKTFLELLVDEGLADHFDIEINDNDPKPWCVAVQGEQLETLKERAQDRLDNEDYDYQAWFFGSKEKGIPKWAGYSIAFSLVGGYLEKVGKSAAEMTDKPAEIFTEE